MLIPSRSQSVTRQTWFRSHRTQIGRSRRRQTFLTLTLAAAAHMCSPHVDKVSGENNVELLKILLPNFAQLHSHQRVV